MIRLYFAVGPLVLIDAEVSLFRRLPPEPEVGECSCGVLEACDLCAAADLEWSGQYGIIDITDRPGNDQGT